MCNSTNGNKNWMPKQHNFITESSLHHVSSTDSQEGQRKPAGLSSLLNFPASKDCRGRFQSVWIFLDWWFGVAPMRVNVSAQCRYLDWWFGGVVPIYSPQESHLFNDRSRQSKPTKGQRSTTTPSSDSLRPQMQRPVVASGHRHVQGQHGQRDRTKVILHLRTRHLGPHAM